MDNKGLMHRVGHERRYLTIIRTGDNARKFCFPWHGTEDRRVKILDARGTVPK